MALVEIKHLKKYYNTPRGLLHAIDDVTMDIEKGKTIGIVGESGCGKSTLGKTLIRMEDATDGEVYFDGKEVTHMSQHEFKNMRMRMQMIFQDPYASLDPRMSVSQLIAEPIQTYHLAKNKKELDEMVFQLMEEVGLAKRLANSYPHELDGGRRQRIGIARALSLNPEFIVCDEPVSALDVSIQAQILNLLMDLQEEKNLTYMFITHDMSVVKHISDDIAVMYLGQVVEKAEYQELFARPLHPYSQALFSAIPVPSIHDRQKRIVLKGEITSPVNPKPCCRFAARCPYATDLCREQEPELRDMGNNHFVKCHRVEELNK
ncbi:ATP-binding cassette domain-containing protein [Firmicutes bacterium TM09-10]|uniref:ABC transporter ATP-binding protein n=1 Tax=Eisenbergiella sp. TaxID=1924109 RepID=UPI000E50A8AE|nr:ATP-binding cassette domain-containing protein [Lachnospiraceae bacterium]RHU26523.1 ATP-binding cassette domain-containing protein [Firmicutes bacterium TM09-10]